MTLTAAADTLVQRGLLRHRRVLLLGARLTGQDRGLRAGLYELEPGLSPRELLADLTTGRSVQIRVTVPEGLDAESAAKILAEALDFDAPRFLSVADSLARGAITARGYLAGESALAVHDSLLREGSDCLPRAFHWSEGYLAPDTYLFAEGTTATAAADHLIATQLARLDTAQTLAAGGPVDSLTGHGLLTLASIVEAEARLTDEQALIAAVYVNRLKRNWRLEADPTVAFILRKKGKRLYFKDLKVESPFNTYRNKGLPPGPIGNPGLSALLAAARPDSACRAMYFVSDGQSGHVFTRTAREHEEAVRRYREARGRSN